MKRPALKIVMPFYNTGRDYTYVAKDHAEDFQKTPIKSKSLDFKTWKKFLSVDKLDCISDSSSWLLDKTWSWRFQAGEYSYRLHPGQTYSTQEQVKKWSFISIKSFVTCK